MQREIDIHGPPGAGKTRRIQQLAVTAAKQFGPEAIGATTFTRAAAAELRGRIGATLGVTDPTRVRKIAPFIGTIHSLAWQAIGRPEIVTHGHLRQFARDVNSNANFRVIDFNPVNGDALQLQEVSADMTEVELMATLYAGARHRHPGCVNDETIRELLPDNLPPGVTFERLIRLITDYAEWKQSYGVVDFEDVLEEGRLHTLPVRVLICDEAQDNTPLLWSVVDAWADSVHTLVVAGDPYQSIYLFAGADPRLLRDRGGDWLHLRDAHRFDHRSAEYAKEILRNGGWTTDRDHEFHTSWRGVGDSPEDGSTFYLARTHALLYPIEARLQQDGTPYGKLRGKAPLGMKIAEEYKEIQLGSRVKHTKDALKFGERYLPYLERVWNAHGIAAFTKPPKINLSTIHGAKGREADEVHLVRSWGILPARNMRQNPTEEACVAYVGASRHRKRLIFEDGEGIPYSFPN